MSKTKNKARSIKIFLLCLVVSVSFIIIPQTEYVTAATNPYPTQQNIDGDAYYEIPCTRYAWQQVYDRYGIALPNWGNAVNWWQSAKNAGYPTGSQPKTGAIAVWSGDKYGHVAFVVSGSGSTFTVNEGGRTDLDSTSSHGIATGYTITNAVGKPRPHDTNKTLLGFIYPVNPLDVSAASVSINASNFTYNRAVQKPSVTSVKEAITGKVLKLNTDYTVSYSNTNSTNVGTYYLTITGIGSHKGVKKLTYKINPLNISKISVASVCPTYWYTGKAIKYNPVVKHGSVTLTNGTHYTVAYKNNINIGMASGTVTGKGNYIGSKSLSFRIIPRKMSVGKLTAKTTSINVKWNKASGGVTGYQVAYKKAKDKNFKTITIKGGSKTSYTISNLKRLTKYVVAVRSYKTVGGKNYYSPYSDQKTIKTKLL